MSSLKRFFIFVLYGIVVTFVVPEDAFAQRTKVPAEGTVYVRLYGNVRGEVLDRGIKTGIVESDNQLIGNGTGFFVSEHGYVLTNEHVVADRNIDVPAGADPLVRIVGHIKITKIEVCPSAATQPQRGGFRNPCVEASVYFADVGADLAVLYIGGSGRPYLAFGDSDALEQSEPVRVLGYPFGVKMEIGREITLFTDTPTMSTVSGSVSAVVIRGESADSKEGKDERLLQLDANVNPGNSGGPVVDSNGFVVGVIQSKLLNVNSVGFAVPVNRVKDFLEVHLLDQLLPSRRLRLGPVQTMEAKGVTLRLPEGMVDSSPFRTRVESESASTGIALRIDRVLSPWSLRELANSVLDGRTFERLSFPNGATMREEGPVLFGRTTGMTDEKKDVGMYFAIAKLGSEALVIRYVGSAEQIAFNARVILDSIESLDVRSLIVGDPGPLGGMTWVVPELIPSAPPVPEGWIVEARGPVCAAASPTVVGHASPRQDFSMTLRFGLVTAQGLSASQAAAGCSARRGALGAASYSDKQDRLGVSYVIEGAFIAAGPSQLIQLETVAPEEQGFYARSLLARWAEKISRGAGTSPAVP